MIEAVFEGNRYSYHKKSGTSGQWLGMSGSGGLFPGANCVAPMIAWPELLKVAVAGGVCRSEFRPPEPKQKPTKKPAKNRSRKISGPSISIF